MPGLLRVWACGVMLALAACGTSPAAVATDATGAGATSALVVTAMASMETMTVTPAVGEAVITAADETATATGETVTAAADETAAAAGETVTLNIFAAASLTEAFEEIGDAFEAVNPGTTLTFNFAGSQQLAQQIEQGAPVDVFASANAAQMNVVIEAGHVVTGTQRTFVRNRLVLIYPRDNPAGITSLKDLAKPGVKLDLAAKEVPVGQYSLRFLDQAASDPEYGPAYKDAVLANVVSYEENVRAVLTKVQLGEVDAGIVYTSDISQDAAGNVGRLDIPDALNTIAQYPIAPISTSANAALAEEFVAYVLSADAQAVLVKYGFIAP